MQTIKNIHVIDNIEKDDFFTMNTNYTRSSNLKIYKEFACSMIRRNFLPMRIASTCNALLQKQSLPQIFSDLKKAIDNELNHLEYVFDY